MTALYLAFSASGEGRRTFKRLQKERRPLNVLVSFVYLQQWRSLAFDFPMPRRILDSGAFSAWKSGKAIDIDLLIEETKRTDYWHESVSLDVIGDAEGSMRNALHMKKAGSPAYPVFHFEDPWEMLAEYKRQFPKVGLSCRFGESVPRSLAWLEGCFSRAYPFKFHSFGWVDERMLKRFPFHSADTASWNNGPSVYGRWKTFGRMSVRGTKDLTVEADYYQRVEKYLQFRWKKELERCEMKN